jgi:hypothetical protein
VVGGHRHDRHDLDRPDGQVWQLSNTDDELGYFTTDQIAGWGTTPIELVTDALSRGGEEVRFVRAQPRRITWPLHIHGDTHLQFLTRSATRYARSR